MNTARWRLFSPRVDRQEVHSTRELVGDADYSPMAIDCMYVQYVCIYIYMYIYIYNDII